MYKLLLVALLFLGCTTTLNDKIDLLDYRIDYVEYEAMCRDCDLSFQLCLVSKKTPAFKCELKHEECIIKTTDTFKEIRFRKGDDI